MRTTLQTVLIAFSFLLITTGCGIHTGDAYFDDSGSITLDDVGNTETTTTTETTEVTEDNDSITSSGGGDSGDGSGGSEDGGNDDGGNDDGNNGGNANEACNNESVCISGNLGSLGGNVTFPAGFDFDSFTSLTVSIGALQDGGPTIFADLSVPLSGGETVVSFSADDFPAPIDGASGFNAHYFGFEGTVLIADWVFVGEVN